MRASVALFLLVVAGCMAPGPAHLPKPSSVPPPLLLPGYHKVAHVYRVLQPPMVGNVPASFQTGPGIATRTSQGVAIVWTNPPPRWTIYSITNLHSTNWTAMFNGATTSALQSVELYSSITNLMLLTNQLGFYKLTATP